ncbi:hypothetical protein KY290_037175 [Solanum tuberosum]|uniref:Uncharacterized protein n=1 Tax=Solanum tuberosum TaxID=4113 RepID=A0ABQ7TYJ9_SOLTU|nr:hypothetical protein KY290_037175 [Solanum tuberosum]
MSMTFFSQTWAFSTDQHYPTNGSSTKHHHPINRSTSFCQWINIILPMDHQRSIIILSVEHQHHFADGSLIIILSMEHQHNPTNGSSTKNHYLTNRAST